MLEREVASHEEGTKAKLDKIKSTQEQASRLDDGKGKLAAELVDGKQKRQNLEQKLTEIKTSKSTQVADLEARVRTLGVEKQELEKTLSEMDGWIADNQRLEIENVQLAEQDVPSKRPPSCGKVVKDVECKTQLQSRKCDAEALPQEFEQNLNLDTVAGVTETNTDRASLQANLSEDTHCSSQPSEPVASDVQEGEILEGPLQDGRYDTPAGAKGGLTFSVDKAAPELEPRSSPSNPHVSVPAVLFIRAESRQLPAIQVPVLQRPRVGGAARVAQSCTLEQDMKTNVLSQDSNPPDESAAVHRKRKRAVDDLDKPCRDGPARGFARHRRLDEDY